VPHVERPDRVRAHELDLHLAAGSHFAGAEARALLLYLQQDGADEVRRQVEVDESRPATSTPEITSGASGGSP